MHSRAVQVLLLILAFALALFLLIASSKYAAWAKPMTAATGSWLPLVFYVGAIPLMSLVYITAHLAALQFNGLPVPPDPTRNQSPSALPEALYDPDYGVSSTAFILGVSILHFAVWLAQSILCTSCELAPVLAGTEGRVPRWCPQSRFRDTGTPGLAGMLGTLAIVKDFLEWGMVLVTMMLMECARREYMRATRIQHEAFHTVSAGVDFGGPSRGDGGPVADLKMAGVTVQLELDSLDINGPAGSRPFKLEPQQRQQSEDGENGALRGIRRRQDGWSELPPGAASPRPTRTRAQMQSQNQDGRVQFPILPSGEEVSATRDAYPGNGIHLANGKATGTGLKRTGTLNHMYESKV